MNAPQPQPHTNCSSASARRNGLPAKCSSASARRTHAGAFRSSRWKSRGRAFPAYGKGEEGAALIIAIWVILILSMLISSMAYDMKVEAKVASFQRNRVKAQYLARAGLEWATAVLSREVTENPEEEITFEPDQDEQLVIASINLSRGVGVSGMKKELGPGSFTIDILPEESRRNVNTLGEEDWDEVFDQAGVENTRWAELYDCLQDWIDEGDEHRLNGAESDDPYYREAGYEVKNAPLDTVDELLMIKGFDENLLYGGPSPESDSVEYAGIAGWLTTWGDGKVNINTASREVLLTLPNIEESVIDDILEYRTGVDGEPNTKDDGFRDLDEAYTKTGLDPELGNLLTVTERKYLRIVSIGEVNGVRNGIWAVLQASEGEVIPVFWREEAMP